MRLRFSRYEADQITRLAPESQRMKALDFAASRATASSTDVGQYGIVHFATHGLINNQHPELSGIVLSLVDQAGRLQNGFLRLYDICNLKLRADLVVLSACQTALGKEVKGEGLVGLTRGFMYAGAPRVVASLWQVDDRATAELMRRFYHGMLEERLRRRRRCERPRWRCGRRSAGKRPTTGTGLGLRFKGNGSKEKGNVWLANSEFAVISIQASRTNCHNPSIF